MGNTKEQDTVFIDAESGFRGSKEDDFSFRLIAMSHFRKICGLASVEFRGGYWASKAKSTKVGVSMIEKTYIPDTREEYSNAIGVLYDILLPHLLAWKIPKNGGRDFIKETEYANKYIEELRKTFIASTEADEKEVLASSNYSGKDKQRLEEYKAARLRLHRKLLRILSCFMFAKGYFESSGLEE